MTPPPAPVAISVPAGASDIADRIRAAMAPAADSRTASATAMAPHS